MKAISQALLQDTIDTLEAYIGDGLDELMPLYDQLVTVQQHHDTPMEKLRYQQGYASGRLLAEADLKTAWVEMDKTQNSYYEMNKQLTDALLETEERLLVAKDLLRSTMNMLVYLSRHQNDFSFEPLHQAIEHFFDQNCK
jgi:hypothetical protein